MRKSQTVVFGVFAALVVIVVAAIIAARVIVAQIESGEATAERRPAPAATRPAIDTDFSGFDRIDARGTWEVTIVQGADWDVALDYSDEIAERLRVRVEGDRLVLGYEDRGWSWWRGFGGDDRASATIVMPALEAVALSGAGTLAVSGFSGPRLAINVSGAAEVNGQDSRYDELELIVSGAGEVNFGDVVVVDARIVLSGAADVTLNMDGGTLGGTISGAGQVRYRGTVRNENVVISGFSTVEPLDE